MLNTSSHHRPPVLRVDHKAAMLARTSVICVNHIRWTSEGGVPSCSSFASPHFNQRQEGCSLWVMSRASGYPD